MSGLFSKPKMPEPEPPAAMPDPQDPLAKRTRRRQGGTLANSATTDKLATVPGTLGREFSRSTLGAS